MKSTKKIFSLFFILFSMAYLYSQVGINTSNPKETLDVEGTVRIKTLGDYNESAIPLSWDAATGKILRGSTTQQKPFYTITYNIKPAPNEDWISNWNTNISSSKYTVIMTSASLEKAGSLAAPIKLYDGGAVGPSAYPFISNGTWRLYADFKSTSPVTNGQYEWKIDLLVINNSLVNTLNNISGTISTGSSGSSPNPIP
jgi:hypothetical protein